MILFLALMTAAYTLVMLYLLFGFHQIKEFSEKSSSPNTTFSVVIPYRNEAENLPRLFRSLGSLSYPVDKYEIILVNDASQDASEILCREFKAANPHLRVTLLDNVRNSGSPKKDALKVAIGNSANAFILTTDADCTVPEEWLQEFDSYLQRSGAKLVAGPVSLDHREPSRGGYLQRFQQLDILSLQAATIGGFGVDTPFLCNGGNLCFEKDSFLHVNGYEGNQQIASGDDVFLLEKFIREKIPVGFLKSRTAVVITQPQQQLSSLTSQRIRWAAKTSAYKNTFGKGMGLLVLLMNAGLVAGFIGMATGILPAGTFLFMFLIKFNVDFVLIYNSASFFGRESAMKDYIWCSVFYPFFSSYVAFVSLVSGYHWKGRRFKK